MTVADVGWDDPDAVALRTELAADIAAAYGRPDSEPAGSGAVGTAMLAFLVARDASGAIGCAGLRRLDGQTGEIKRMYVRPAARGSGTADALLAAVESAAAGHGLTRLRLETGDRLLAAQAFYRRSGYAPIPRYGPYVGSALSRCFERVLPSPEA